MLISGCGRVKVRLVMVMISWGYGGGGGSWGYRCNKTRVGAGFGAVQQTVAALVTDELALSQQIRTKLANALEALDPTDPVAFRGLAAASTTLKLTQDVTRRSLPIEKLNQASEFEELPVLQIHIMTEQDVAEMRAKQRLEEAEISGDTQGTQDELENLRWMESRRLAQLDQTDEDDDIVYEGVDSLMTGT